MEGVAQSRLVTLGRLALVDAHGIEEGSLKKRRRKLAVLAVLALERRPLSRDSLIEMFWGDQPEENARHSLSDALSHLRRLLGRDAISVRSAEVALDADALAVDAIEMIAAMEAGDFARALALYGGPLLDGVYIGGSPRFENWLDRERDRFHRLFLRASREHCVTLAKEARWTDCIAVAQRWVDAEPLSPDAAVALLHALAAPDTTDAHPSAIAAYTKLRARLARDFELAPSAEVAAVAARSEKKLAAAAAARAVPSSRSARSSVDPLAATHAASAAPSAGALPAVLNTRRMAKRYSLAGGALVVL